MADISNLNDLFTSLVVGDINLITGFVWLLIAIVLSMVGGAVGGVLLASKDIGYEFSAMLGGLLAPAGAIPAIVFGLFVLKLLTNL
ncbi:hypothetical protein G7B40_035355 [Aetokthonos hydrillicola Thurmond2011]|jgi:ABC-type phosphate transport system permease subunit|uniref:Uncharacterized protein n=1 Tax=Aetokthonos hydrillicola Thurmond2011 TaxID=2712845 RepID=A0AAP5IDU2_9CYAN|nr:hypothetical protein [Aetokthonos hydrillicola]MBO3460100.1 hypothetical protein [Aetokthonos hydrillicola CCALA 1050]MBW4589502.1 hypothetical protein [Aetokthonos hydrillicola CCALA 1050]MDR9899798.1 hypothetical protein [Aetokthonos hydrillicola Thurmond2011]